MRKYRQVKIFANVTLWIILIGAIVIISGFGLSLNIAQREVTADVDMKVQRDIDYLNAYIDGNLSRIEDAGYSFSSLVFGDVIRDGNGHGYVEMFDRNDNPKPSPEQIYEKMEKFMRATPIVCGIAIEFEPYVYPEVKSKYGFTPYVTNVSGNFEHLDLGEITNSFEWEWYTRTKELGKGYWSKPFQDSSIGHVIACYSIPVYSKGKLLAVMAIDIDTEAISNKCSEISPYPGAQVFLLDQDFNFISHPDRKFLMKNVSELESIADTDADGEIKSLVESGRDGHCSVRIDDANYMIYFSSVPRTGWTISIQCPENEVYGGVDRMKRSTTIIAIVSILIMSLILIMLFRRFQNVSVKEAGIKKELNVAHGIQSEMLPKVLVTTGVGSRLDVFGFQKPAKSVGGDLYDYFIRDNKFFFCIGDVSGKGIPASLYMVVILALFRNISRKESDPARIAEELNNTLSSSNNTSMFCTMFFGVLDLETGKLEFCNAGHNRPMIYRCSTDEVSYQNVNSNVALGIVEDFSYCKEEMNVEKGDAIFLYTDGLTEAENEEKTLFGDDAALEAFGRSVSGNSSRQCIDRVLESVLHHAEKTEQNDDITMLMVKINS